MSRRNKKQKVEETVNNEVIVDAEENKTETEEIKEDTEDMKEKKNFIFKIGETAGKVVGGVKKVVTSKPAKIIGGVVIVGTALAAGYKLGKDGIPEIGMKDDDDFDSEDTDYEVEEETCDEPEEAVETTESDE